MTPAPVPPLAVCVDIGSTYTKALVVGLDDGALFASAGHPTTVGTDVLDGVDAVLARLSGLLPGADLSRVYACSSAGGGLRLAVVGYEPLVSAEAGRRVALSAGARVVQVAAGPLADNQLGALRAASPDVVLLVGGTDGGDAEVLRHNGARLAVANLGIPVVVAGNADASGEVAAGLRAHGVPVVLAGNPLPRIGVLDPAPARSAIREVFLRHVIGGSRLSRGPRLAGLVRAATPEAVLTAVELLADSGAAGGDLLVVDVGGATTDVYSALVPDSEAGGRYDEVAGVLWRSRTVEGDLGVRGNAPGVLAAARAERLLDDAGYARLAEAAQLRAERPRLPVEPAVDLELVRLAAVVALRRHARGTAAVSGGTRRGGRDLRRVGLVVGSGGVLRHCAPDAALAVVASMVQDAPGGWPLPRAPQCTVDTAYVLAAAGLLAADHAGTAHALLCRHLCGE